MKQIRCGVFETNSSSTHSLTICTKNEYESWKNEKLVYDCWNEKLVLPSTLSEEILNDLACDGEADGAYFTYKGYTNRDTELASFNTTYTTPKGEKIVVFGEYGYDG